MREIRVCGERVRLPARWLLFTGPTGRHASFADTHAARQADPGWVVGDTAVTAPYIGRNTFAAAPSSIPVHGATVQS